MSLTSKFLVAVFCASVATATHGAKEARVTRIIRDVKLLPHEEEAKPAAINDRVDEDTAVRTGDQSRSELTFPDFTITRLGANSVFSFNKAGRSVDLEGGSILLRVPKDSGGANIRAAAVSVAVTGTTLILETQGNGRSKLIVLEGAARLALRRNSAQNKNVLAGQMLDVPAGATTLPDPVNIDLNQVMKNHPLIVGFPPLPSQKLIADAAARQRNRPPDEPVYQGQPVAGGPTIGVGGITLPPFFGGGTRGGGTRPPPNNPGGGGTVTQPTNPKTPGGATVGRGQRRPPAKTQSTPAPIR